MIARILRYFGIFLSILSIIYISVSLTINFKKLYLEFNKQLADVGYDVKTSSIEVSHFPIPTVMLGNVNVPGIFTAKKFSLKFSIFSILTFNPHINMLEASDVKIETSGANMIDHETTIIKMFQIFPHIPNTDLTKVILTDKRSGIEENIQYVLILILIK